MTMQSPGVFTSEDEIGTVVPNAGVGTSATVGRFNWGPAFQQVSVASPTVLLDTFKAPDRAHRYSYLSTEILTRASNDVRVVRAVDRDTAKNGKPLSSGSAGVWEADVVSLGNLTEFDVESAFGVRARVGEVLDESSNIVGYITITKYDTIGIDHTVEIDYNGDASNLSINWLNLQSGETAPEFEFVLNSSETSKNVVNIVNPGFGFTIGEVYSVIDTNVGPGSIGYIIVVNVDDIGDGEVLKAITSYDGEITGSISFESIDENNSATFSLEAISLTVSYDLFIANDSEVVTVLSATNIRDAHNSTNTPAIFARFPGEYGNRITVDVVSFEDFDTEVALTDNISGDPVNVSFSGLDTVPSKAGQFAVIVRDNDQVVLQTVVSTDEDDRNIFGQSIYINDLADTGKLGLVTGSADFGWNENSTGRYHMQGGDNGDVVAGMFFEAWDLLSDSSLNPAQVMSSGPTNGEDPSIAATVAGYARDIAEARGDTLLTIGTPPSLIAGLKETDAVSAEVEYRTGQDSSGQPVSPNIAGTYKHATYIANAKWTYDRFNDSYFWMDIASDKAARIVNVLSANIPWQSASGTQFGVVTGVRKLAYNPVKGMRDTLYTAGINPTVLNNGSFYIRGDKTMWPEPSAFSRENVRQVFNKLKTDISRRAANLEFQQNTASLRRQYKNETDSYMRNLVARGGVEDFRNFVEELNTPEVRANNEFRARHAVKPVYSINYVVLQFTSVGPDVTFEELEG